MSLYDEFGNYIGPDLDEDEEDFDQDEDDFDREDDNDYQNGALVNQEENEDENTMDVDGSNENRIVLHEDKKYYPDAEEVYPGVKTVTMDEDAQDLNEPIIKPVKQKNFSVLTKEIPELRYDTDFMATLMNTPHLIRNVAIVGHLHHGKTNFVDVLVQATQTKEWDPSKEIRYTDTRVDEQARQMSIKSTPISLVLDDLKGKSYLINSIDCPGHANFIDESTAAFRAVDGVVLVVDAVEGVMLNTQRVIKQAVISRLPICLVRI